MRTRERGKMSGHSSWPEWVYIGVVVALLCYVGAEAWNIERIIAVSYTHLTLPTILRV